jgi:hypothetical protein
MPTRRAKIRRAPGLDPYRIEQLVNGPELHGPFPDEGYPDTPEGRAEMRADWEHLRDEILQWYVFGKEWWPGIKIWQVVAPGGPGTRPWSWWEFDAPGPLPDDETERDYLIRHGLMLPGEADLPTRAELEVKRDAEMQSEIGRNLAQLSGGKGADLHQN